MISENKSNQFDYCIGYNCFKHVNLVHFIQNDVLLNDMHIQVQICFHDTYRYMVLLAYKTLNIMHHNNIIACMYINTCTYIYYIVCKNSSTCIPSTCIWNELIVHWRMTHLFLLWISVQNGRSYSRERIIASSSGCMPWMEIYAAVVSAPCVGRFVISN